MSRDISQATTFKDKVRPASAVSRWSMDNQDVENGAIKDTWGSNDGTIKPGSSGDNTTVSDMTGATGIGHTGEAFDFDGSGDYIDSGYGGSVWYSDSWTFSAWIKTKSTNEENIAGQRDSNARPSIQFRINHDGENNISGSSGDLSILFRDSNGNYLIWGANIGFLNDGNWHHVVATARDLSQEDVSTYIDGMKVGGIGNNESPSYTAGSFSSNFSIGGALQSESINRPINADIDEVRIYNEALTQQQVWKLYNIGRNANWGYSRS